MGNPYDAGGVAGSAPEPDPHRPASQEELRQLPVGELVKQLAEETSLLVREELQLAKAELTQQGKRAGIGIGELGGAGLVGLYALGALTACFIAALALALPVWAAALIVAAVYGAIAGVLALVGRRQLRQNLPPKPTRTERTVKEDIEWAKSRKP